MAVVCIWMIIPMLFLRRRTYFIVCGMLWLFCAPIEMASLYLNHNPATATFVGLFYATNYHEVIGILSVAWPLLIGVMAVWIIYFVLASRQPNEWIIPRKTGIWSVGLCLSVLLAGSMLFFSSYAKKVNNIQDRKEAIALAKNLTLMKFYKIFPYNIYLNAFSVASDHYQARRTQEQLASFRFGISSDNRLPEIYILVIGEAARSGNFSINGYERETNPRLARRTNLLSFPNMYSQAGTTEQSVPHMISRIPVTLHKQCYLEKTLPEAFQEAGFQAVWLSNQSRILSFERILSTADIRYETGKDMSVTNNYDEYLLAPLQKAFKSGMKKQFIVVHTMGSHWRYDTRYPNSFEQYTPSLGKDFTWSMITPANRQQLLNAYDNTILYTDYFLDSLLTTVENQHTPALVMYTSDHGENLYDDERNLVLHGNYSASKWLFHVPFIVWYSDEYAQLYPNKIAQLYTHKDIRDNSSVIFHSMMDAAGLQYNNNTASNAEMHTRSIFSNEYCMPDTLYVLTAEEECIALEE